jgi:hypothetical protein
MGNHQRKGADNLHQRCGTLPHSHQTRSPLHGTDTPSIEAAKQCPGDDDSSARPDIRPDDACSSDDDRLAVADGASEALPGQSEGSPVDRIRPAMPDAEVQGEGAIVQQEELARLLQELDASIDAALGSPAGAQDNYLAERAVDGAPASSRPKRPRAWAPYYRLNVMLLVAGGVVFLGLMGWVWQENPMLFTDRAQSVTSEPIASTGKVITGRRPLSKAPRAAPGALRASAGPKPTLTDTPPASARDDVASAVESKEASGPLQAPAGQPVPLGLSLPEAATAAEISIMVQGVPERATLTAGKRVGGSTWIASGDKASTLALVTPEDFPSGPFEIKVTLVSSDGTIAYAHTLQVAVDASQASALPQDKLVSDGEARAPRDPAPTALAPRDGTPWSAEPSRDDTSQNLTVSETNAKETKITTPRRSLAPEDESRLLKRGRSLLQRGDVAAARLLFEHVARHGSRSAMKALGDSYDAKHLSELGVVGINPDRRQAAYWYERAARVDTADADSPASAPLKAPPPVDATADNLSSHQELSTPKKASGGTGKTQTQSATYASKGTVEPSRTEPVTANVNMRAEPSMDAEVITVVPADGRVAVLECGQWCKVTYGNQSGWVHRRFIGEARR